MIKKHILFKNCNDEKQKKIKKILVEFSIIRNNYCSPKFQILENLKKKYWSHIGHINIAPPISGERWIQ
jgi:hypothetical protein